MSDNDNPGMLARWQSTWAASSAREKNLTRLAAGLVLLALLWWVGVAPALRAMQNAQQQMPALERQLDQMRVLQAQAQKLQAQPRLSQDDALKALESSVKERLGTSAQLSVNADRATLSLKGTSADGLAGWLAQVRANARALPVEAHLVRGAGNSGTWDGTLVLALPPR